MTRFENAEPDRNSHTLSSSDPIHPEDRQYLIYPPGHIVSRDPDQRIGTGESAITVKGKVNVWIGTTVIGVHPDQLDNFLKRLDPSTGTLQARPANSPPLTSFRSTQPQDQEPAERRPERSSVIRGQRFRNGSRLR